MLKKIRKFFSVVIILGISLGTILVIVPRIAEDLGLIDSDALYGGDLERGYPSAGFLISYEPGGGFKTCGYSVLSNRIAITASHCVDNSEKIYIGKGEFNPNPGLSQPVSKAIQKEGWVNSKNRRDDFAILTFNDNRGFFTDFAQIASPAEGCNYRVVAYGRTEQDAINGGLERPRKSALLCISQIDNDIFIVKGLDNKSGICFGDSGSPIYSNETNQVVGVIASIVLEKPNDPNPCAFGNTAIAVRADNNQRLINDQISALPGDIQSNVQVQDLIVVDVVNETLFDQIGLGYLTTSLQGQVLLLISSSLTAGVLLILVIVMLRRSPKSSFNPSEYQPQTYY